MLSTSCFFFHCQSRNPARKDNNLGALSLHPSLVNTVIRKNSITRKETAKAGKKEWWNSFWFPLFFLLFSQQRCICSWRCLVIGRQDTGQNTELVKKKGEVRWGCASIGCGGRKKVLGELIINVSLTTKGEGWWVLGGSLDRNTHRKHNKPHTLKLLIRNLGMLLKGTNENCSLAEMWINRKI